MILLRSCILLCFIIPMQGETRGQQKREGIIICFCCRYYGLFPCRNNSPPFNAGCVMAQLFLVQPVRVEETGFPARVTARTDGVDDKISVVVFWVPKLPQWGILQCFFEFILLFCNGHGVALSVTASLNRMRAAGNFLVGRNGFTQR